MQKLNKTISHHRQNSIGNNAIFRSFIFIKKGGEFFDAHKNSLLLIITHVIEATLFSSKITGKSTKCFMNDI